MNITAHAPRLLARLTAGLGLLALASSSWAQLSDYTQDFEGLNAADPAALDNDAWIHFGNVFDGGGGYLFGYGPNAAPNGGNISAVASGEGGPDQGAQQLSVFSDYDCCQPSNGHFNGTDRVETNVFQEQTIGAGDVGETYVFQFDGKAGNLGGATTATAFIKILDPNAGFALTGSAEADMTALDATWNTYTLSITINAAQPGQILQFGFNNTAANFEPSGNFYDNISFTRDASAALGPYSQDFEALGSADPDALANDGWEVFGNVFDSGGAYLFGYGPFDAPNGGPGFSAVASGQGGPDQGLQQLSIYNDYNCCQPSNGHFNGTDRVEASVFRQLGVTAANVGETWTFSFEAKRGNLEGASTAQAFIKTLDPAAGFALTNNITVDMTGVGTDWTGAELSITIDSSLPGQLIQVGFASTAENFEGSGVFYDNINLARDESALLAPYAQNFEGLDQASPSALGDDGWTVFANVFSPDGVTYLYGYGPFPAPNGGPGFSGIDIGQGGPDQGAQQLVVYNDYGNPDHNTGERIEANVFQERGIIGTDVGGTWTFSFDAKKGNIEGASTAVAFLQTLDPAAGFMTTNRLEVDTTALPDTWGRYQVSLEIDASLPGQILQFGFSTTAASFEGSGNFYDNVLFDDGTDTDGDGVSDVLDNCTLVANPSQTDTDGDNIGNACDADIFPPGGGDCAVNFGDLSVLKAGFFPVNDPLADFNGDGGVNFGDLAYLKQTFFNGAEPGPGPGAPGNACE